MNLILSLILADAGAVPLPFQIGGLGGGTALVIYLIRELRKSSGGVWRIVREKNTTMHYQNWRISKLEYDLAVCRGTATSVQDPGPYVAPSPEEIKSW